MNKHRCRFGVRVPFLKNLGVIVVYLPLDVANRVTEAVALLKASGGKDTDRIVWEVE